MRAVKVAASKSSALPCYQQMDVIIQTWRLDRQIDPLYHSVCATEG
ncbi:MAG: hypothetical protein R2865_01860 [Deinococcales bacterium]